MNYYKSCLSYLLTAAMLMVLSSACFAASSASPQDSVSCEYNGLKVWGGASGDKLNGVIQVSFSDLTVCDPAVGDPLCKYDPSLGFAYNQGNAKVSMFLSTTNANNKELNTKAFYVDLGVVSVWDLENLQKFITEDLQKEIIAAFGIVDDDPLKPQAIYLKSITAAPYYTADDEDGAKEFTVMAEVVLAVDTEGKEADKDDCEEPAE